MHRFCLITALLSAVVLLSAPSGASAQTGTKTYEVTVTNRLSRTCRASIIQLSSS
jgi:hypothetical protein